MKKPTAPKKNSHLSTLALANLIVMSGAAKAADATDTTATTPVTPAPKSAPKAAAPTAKAGTGTSTPANTSTLNEVVVTADQESAYQAQMSGNGKYTSPLLDIPQSITVVPQQLMQDQHASTLRDVLQNVPGVTFGAGEGATLAGDNITIRGFNAQEDIFVDGFRDTGVYNRDPFNLEQVEVVKGPASAYAGHGTVGGYVNLITKTPTLDPHYEVNTGYGTNQYYRETLDINQPLTGLVPNAAFRVNAVYQSNNYSNLGYLYDSRWGANPEFAFGIGTDTLVKVSYFFLQEQNLPTFGLPPMSAAGVGANPTLAANGNANHVAPVDYSNFYGFVNRDYQNATTHIPSIYFFHEFDKDFKIENTARYEYTLLQSITTAPRFDAISNSSPTLLPPLFTPLPNGAAPPTGLMTREMKSRHQLDTLIGDQFQSTNHFQTWMLDHTLVTDAEFTHQDEDARSFNGTNIATSIYDPNPNDQYPFSTQFLGPESRTSLDDASFSLFDTIKLEKQWTLSGGMRYDHLEENTQIDANYLTNPITPFASLHRTDDLASWRVALNYKPVENGTIYFGYGTSYNPSIEGGQDSASPDGLATNTVNLPPEENETYEVGSKWNLLDDKLSVDGAFFLTNKTNARITDPTAPPGTTVFALTGKQRVEGFDFSTQGNLTKEWKIFGGYTYMQSEIVSGPPSSFPGNHLPNTPNQMVSFWSTYELPEHVTLGGGVNFVDKRYGNVNNTTIANGYWTGQLMAAYKINQHFNVQVNVYNLWDTEYIAAVGSNFTQGSGRSVVVSAEIEY